MLIPHNKYVDENDVEWTKSRCFFCHMNCAILIGVKDDKIVAIEPNDQHGTVLCDRMGEHGRKAIKFYYHPKRINHVLKRVGKRGEDKWEEIPYDQALDEVAAKLKEIKEKYGPEAIVASEGTYRSDHLWARTRFMNLFGNPGNVVDPGTICWCYTYTVNMAMVGWPIEAVAPPTAPDADVIVLWGLRNDERYGPDAPIWRLFRGSMEREGKKPKVIVVDPVCISAVQYASSWLAINPGTDAFMIMAWANYMVENDLYDKDFIKEWSNGPFLIRKDNKQLVRGSDIDKNGKFEDFVAFNDKTGKIAVWCSDECRYYEGDDVDTPIYGEFEVKMTDGSTVTCVTAFTEIAARLKEYTIEKAAAICGVPEEKIKEAVQVYATYGNGYIAWGIGGGDMAGYNATNCALAKTYLRILSGNVDVVGGEYIGNPGDVDPNGAKNFPVRDSEFELTEIVTPETRVKFLGNDQFRTMSWKGFEKIDVHYKKMWNIPRPQMHQMLVTPTLAWDAILTGEPYPVKALISWSSNPMIWAANTKHVYEALKAVELHVAVEYWKTPTSILADYIFPAADSLERHQATTLEDSCDFIIGGDRGSKPLYDRRMDYDFFRGLGIRLGQENDWPWETYEDIVAYRVERAGYTYDQFVEEGMIEPPQGMEFEKHKDRKPNGELRGFATPSRKAEIFPSVIQELGYDPIPNYREPESPLSNPEMAKEYPMRLTISGRRSPMYHSEMRVPGNGTRSQWPYPIVKVHMHDGRRLGLRDGDWTWIETPLGRIKQIAKLAWDITEGTVQVSPSWWYPELPMEEPWLGGVWISNGNVLTNDAVETLDPGTGTWCNRGLLCRVYPAIDPADRIDNEISLDDFIAGHTFFHKNYR